MNSDLDKFKLWADQWLVKFSAEKTGLMTCSFRSIDHPDIVFNGVVLPEVDTHKHLGITLSSNLSWSSHIDTILGSVSPTDLGSELSKKVFDAVHRFIDESDRL